MEIEKSREKEKERERERGRGGKVARTIGEETKGVDNRENNRNWRLIIRSIIN